MNNSYFKIDKRCSHLLSNLIRVLNVQLVEGLNVLVDEGDGDQHQVLLAALHQGCKMKDLV